MPHPLIGAMLESILRRLIGMSLVYSLDLLVFVFEERDACCNNVLVTVFEETFPDSKAIVDYMEFRLLEVRTKACNLDSSSRLAF